MARKSGMGKLLRGVHGGYIVIAAVFLLLGIGIGAFGGWYITAEDKLELNGERNITVEVGEMLSYTDEGVTCVSKGKTLGSNDVEITTDMTVSEDGKTFTADTSEPGEYYIQYTVKSGRFAGLSRVRIFTVEADAADAE